MKICRLCKKEKELCEFYANKQTKSCVGSWCKKCDSNWKKEQRLKIKKTLVDYKGGCCVVCNYNRYIGALEFHHLDPSKKDFGISSHSSVNIEKLKKEVDKCILVCSVCHKEIHAGISKWSKGRQL